MTVHIIRTDGTEESRTITAATLLRDLEPVLQIRTFDTVNLRDGRVMLVDDDGYETETIKHPDVGGVFHVELRPTRARKPVNAKATALYHGVCRPGTTHQIVGDVAIVWDKDLE